MLRNTTRNRRPSAETYLIILALSLLSTACDNPDSGGVSKSKALPNLEFHKPESLNLAISRLREIHDAIVDQGPLPEPREFEVLEVVHGEGVGAHSHYYLAGQDRQDHHHEDMKEEEKTHRVQVDVFTEFEDIVTWLPRIAAATDGMNEGTFKTVSNVSAELSKLTRKLSQDRLDEKDGRQNFRDSTNLQSLIKKLETLVDDANDAPTSEASS